MRFEQTGVMQDLDEAINSNHQALQLLPPGHPGRASSCGHLASAVLTRFETTGRIEDLKEAIEILKIGHVEFAREGERCRSTNMASPIPPRGYGNCGYTTYHDAQASGAVLHEAKLADQWPGPFVNMPFNFNSFEKELAATNHDSPYYATISEIQDRLSGLDFSNYVS